ncbi:uncharacterized [Tachysurus ichikawai]
MCTSRLDYETVAAVSPSSLVRPHANVDLARCSGCEVTLLHGWECRDEEEEEEEEEGGHAAGMSGCRFYGGCRGQRSDVRVHMPVRMLCGRRQNGRSPLFTHIILFPT